jgi:hypothetical protein
MEMLTIKALQNAIRALETGDPLQQRGIPKDWVCVIHPAIEQKLRYEMPKNEPDSIAQLIQPPPMAYLAYDVLRQYTGRETWVIDAAPMDKVEYMAKETMFGKYAQWFMARAILARTQKEDDDNLVSE